MSKDNKNVRDIENSASDAKKALKMKKVMAAVIIAACLIAAIGVFFMSTDIDFGAFGGADTKKPQLVYDGNGEHRMSLWDPDWDTDIFTAERWLEKNRYLTYVYNGAAETIIDGDYSSYGDTVAFFADYFDTLMHGDAEGLNTFYADSYFEDNERFDAITMQKIYDMRIEYLSGKDIDNTTVYVYKVTYKILENDGTFRDDMVSDAERAQFYTLLDNGYEIKITDVSYSYTVE